MRKECEVKLDNEEYWTEVNVAGKGREEKVKTKWGRSKELSQKTKDIEQRLM